MFLAFLGVILLVAVAIGFAFDTFNRFGRAVESTTGRIIPHVSLTFRLSERAALVGAKIPLISELDDQNSIREVTTLLKGSLSDIGSDIDKMAAFAPVSRLSDISGQLVTLQANVGQLEAFALRRADILKHRREAMVRLDRVQSDVSDNMEAIVFGANSLTRLFAKRAGRRISGQLKGQVVKLFQQMSLITEIHENVQALSKIGPNADDAAVRHDCPRHVAHIGKAVENLFALNAGWRSQFEDQAKKVLQDGLCTTPTSARATEAIKDLHGGTELVLRTLPLSLGEQLERAFGFGRGAISDVAEEAIRSLQSALSIKAESNLLISLLRSVAATGNLSGIAPLRNLHERSLSALQDNVSVFYESDLAQRNPILADNIEEILVDLKTFGEGQSNLFTLKAEELTLAKDIHALMARSLEVSSSMTRLSDDLMARLEVDISGIHKGLEQAEAAGKTALIMTFFITTLAVVVIGWLTNRAVVERERALSEAKRAAEHASSVKSEFLANMSHELRTPLNAILGFSGAMKHQVFGPFGNTKYSEYVDHVLESGEHLLELINDILDLSKIEAGAFELDEEPVDIANTFAAVTRLVCSRIEANKIQLQSRIRDDLPLLLCDKRRLKQILLNLMTNAIKFTQEGGQVTLEAHVGTKSELVLVVADTGVGMTAEEVEIALSTFGQVSSRISRKDVGTGLGLPLTKALIEVHGGTMRIESLKGDGTRVVLTFPPERSILRAVSE